MLTINPTGVPEPTPEGPSEFGTEGETGKDRLAGLWMNHGIRDGVCRFHLRGRKTRCRVLASAFDRFEVEATIPGIVNQAILQSIDRIACIHDGPINHRVLR
jgi:hypothetical protein